MNICSSVVWFLLIALLYNNVQGVAVEQIIKCQLTADILFVIDSSGSLSDQNYSAELRFVDNIAKSFKVGPDDVQYSAFIFSSTVQNLFYFKDHSSIRDMSEALLQAPHLGLTTATGEALDYARTVSLQISAGARPGVDKLVFVITDGESDSYSHTQRGAELLKKTGAHVISIGVGAHIDMYELLLMATSDHDLYMVDDFDVLHTIHDSVTNRTCHVVTEIPQICAAFADVILVIDSSSSVNAVNFSNYDTMTTFVANLTQLFDLGPSATQFGAVVFGNEAHKEFDLKNFTKESELTQAILKLPYLSQRSNTAAGLQLIVQEDMFGSAAGGRQLASKSVIVITDGPSTDSEETQKIANTLRDKDVEIFAVGVGQTSLAEWTDIAGDAENVFTTMSFQTLQQDVLSSLQHILCHASIETPSSASPSSTTMSTTILPTVSSSLTPISTTTERNGPTPTDPSVVMTSDSTLADSSPSASVPTLPPCAPRADIVFLLDSSASVTTANWEDELQFAAKIANRFVLGRDSVQIGAVTFSSIVEQHIELDEYFDQTDLAETMMYLPHLKGGTATYRGLDLVREKAFTVSAGARNNSAWIVILLTDGASDDEQRTLESANKLKETGVTIVTVGIGNVNKQELEAVASSADDVFYTTGFDALQRIGQEVENRTCDIPDIVDTTTAAPSPQTTTTTGPSTTTLASPPTPTTTTPGPIVGQCDALADIVFLLDSSESEGKDGWQGEIKFARTIAQRFILGPEDVQIAAVTFSSSAEVAFQLDEFTDHSALDTGLSSVTYLNEGTLTYVGLDLIREQVFNTSAGLRSGATRIVILLTDGQSKDYNLTIEAANKLKQTGVTIVTVGIGNVNKKELEAIASSSNDVFYTTGYDALHRIEQDVGNRTCEISPSTTESTSVSPFSTKSTPVWPGSTESTPGFGGLPLCPLGLQQNNLAQVGSYCFQFHLDELREYDAAKITCQRNGGTLAMPKTSELQLFLKTYLRLNKIYDEPVWIGLTDQDNEKEFHWDDGTILHPSSIYSNWGINQGHNQNSLLEGEYQDCVALDPSDEYKWHDYHCTDSFFTGFHSFPFICQYAVSVTLPHFTTDSLSTAPHTTNSWSNPSQTTDSGPISAQTTDGFGTTDSETGCSLLADIILVMDSSGSINRLDDKNYGRQLQFAVNITRSFALGEDSVRVGAVVFDGHANKLFDLDNYTDHSSLEKALLSAPYLGGGTATYDALEMVDKDMFDVANEARDNAIRIIILITDGRTFNASRTYSAAESLKSSGVHIVAIGVSSAEESELQTIASSPQDVFIVTDFLALGQLTDIVPIRICQVPEEQDSSTVVVVGRAEP